MIKLRWLLIRMLAGKIPVVMNVTINQKLGENGSVMKVGMNALVSGTLVV